jgi:hypothetical protein|tara:strand:- start:1001 stop:1399 length:399 start_codon:yes stop_codon:yes gene_type:complete
MAYFAKIDENNIVLRVSVVHDSIATDEAAGVTFLKQHHGSDTNWKQTFIEGGARKNYAGIGYKYDSSRNAFIPETPYPSWVINETTCLWESPLGDPPTLTEEQRSQNTAQTHAWGYDWNESGKSWDLTNAKA